MYTEKVNVFQGCGEIDLPEPQGIAATWFFLKAGCGNTVPAAALPYGKISVCAFTGGYPTGYGNHLPNSHSRPAKFEEGKKAIGFAHVHQSGTGAMGYYYNYAVAVPHYADTPRRFGFCSETAVPGYYSCKTDGIECEFTVTKNTALHRYTFAKSGGAVRFDFTNNGLDFPGCDRLRVEDTEIRRVDSHTLTAAFTAEKVRLYFAVRSDCLLGEDNEFKADGVCNIRVALSLRSEEKALGFLGTDEKDFDTAKRNASEEWEKFLSRIRIEADGDIPEIFYSNLYHSLVKPADFGGESFIYGGDGPFVADFNTFWDMYKSQLPLVFLTDREMSVKITETIMSVCESCGRIPNSWGLTRKFEEHDSQARMLGCYTLMQAYRTGIPVDAKRMLKCIKTDLLAENKLDFTENGKCSNYSWTLDMSDCCGLAKQIAEEIGDTESAAVFEKYSGLWKTVYDADTGLMKAESEYYEGSLWNYSFRPHVSMDERIEIAGGRDAFIAKLDRFFGYGCEPVVQPTDPHDYSPVAAGAKLGRFEGFNNESDTEAPFSYIFAGRPDRTAEIIRAGMKYMFVTGRGGLPGNNDTGALSSYYVWNAFGLHPLCGFGFVLVTSPLVSSAEISLSSGNTLRIRAYGNSDRNIYVKSAKFNGNPVENSRIPLRELMNGGLLEFEMSGTP